MMQCVRCQSRTAAAELLNDSSHRGLAQRPQQSDAAPEVAMTGKRRTSCSPGQVWSSVAAVPSSASRSS